MRQKKRLMLWRGVGVTPTPPPVFDNTYSLDFDAVDDYVDINTTAAALNFPSTTISSGSFTISFWYKFGSTTNFDAVIDNSNFSTNGFGIWQDTTNDNLNFWVGHYSTSNVVGGSTLSSGTWYNITCVFVGGATHTLEIFIDGVSDGTASYTATKTIHTGRNIIIGDNSGTQSRYIDATLDELAIWDSDQSANVGTIYGGGSPINLTSLSPLAWYRMGDSGTFFNSNWEIPEYTKIDNWSSHSFDFDGTDDTITTGLDCTSATHPDISVSCWLKINSHSGIQFPVGVECGYSQYISLGLLNGGILYYKANGGWVSGGSLNDGNWHNIVWAFSYDNPTSGDMTVKVYKDGNTTPVIDTIDNGYQNPILTGNLFIGSEEGTGLYFNGLVDDVSVFNKIISTAEVTSIWNSGEPTDLSAESGLIGYWRMGEGSNWNGTNWQLPDYSKNTLFSQKSLNFDGVDDLINFGNWQLLDGVSACTISFWIKSGVDASNAYVIARVESTPQFTIFQKATNNYMWYRLYTGTSYTVQGGAVLDNEWHHCMMVYNGSTLEVFEDGVSVGSTAVTGTLPVSTSELRVASYAGGSPFKSGNIDDIAIFDSAKAIGDVWDGSGSPTDLSSESGLVGYWTFDDATFSTNWTVPDNSTNSNDGTSSGMVETDLEFNTPTNLNAGLSSGMAIDDKVNNAPDNINQGLSSGMDEVDRVEETP